VLNDKWGEKILKLQGVIVYFLGIVVYFFLFCSIWKYWSSWFSEPDGPVLTDRTHLSPCIKLISYGLENNLYCVKHYFKACNKFMNSFMLINVSKCLLYYLCLMYVCVMPKMCGDCIFVHMFCLEKPDIPVLLPNRDVSVFQTRLSGFDKLNIYFSCFIVVNLLSYMSHIVCSHTFLLHPTNAYI
jgi:hypothetical protein